MAIKSEIQFIADDLLRSSKIRDSKPVRDPIDPGCLLVWTGITLQAAALAGAIVYGVYRGFCTVFG